MKIVFTILLILTVQLAFAQNFIDTSKVYIFVEQQPYPNFPGCDSTLGRVALVKCQQEKLKRFIDFNLKSPNPAMEAMVGISFIVAKDGSLSDFVIDKAPTPDFGEEAMRVLKLLPNWIPGKQSGRLVRVKYLVPVKFQKTK